MIVFKATRTILPHSQSRIAAESETDTFPGTITYFQLSFLFSRARIVQRRELVAWQSGRVIHHTGKLNKQGADQDIPISSRGIGELAHP